MDSEVSILNPFNCMFPVEAHLPGLLDSFRPDLVLYDAGVDPHTDDDLGRLRLTDTGEWARSYI